jgi:N-acetylmuramoyl-L-alanine amidase CwlA
LRRLSSKPYIKTTRSVAKIPVEQHIWLACNGHKHQDWCAHLGSPAL